MNKTNRHVQNYTKRFEKRLNDYPSCNISNRIVSNNGTMSNNHKLTPVANSSDFTLNYHFSIIFNGNGKFSDDAKSVNSIYYSISNNANDYNSECCKNNNKKSEFKSNFVTLPSENLIKNKHIQNKQQHYVSSKMCNVAPLTKSNLSKLNYLNRTVYLPKSNENSNVYTSNHYQSSLFI